MLTEECSSCDTTVTLGASQITVLSAGGLGYNGDLSFVISRVAESAGRCISETTMPLINRLGVCNASSAIGGQPTAAYNILNNIGDNCDCS